MPSEVQERERSNLDLAVKCLGVNPTLYGRFARPQRDLLPRAHVAIFRNSTEFQCVLDELRKVYS